MANRDLIVIGASAGGIEALRQLCAALPGDLKAAILIVVHVSPYSDALLPRVLTRVGALTAVHPSDGEQLARGHIYVAPPDVHMLVEAGYLRLVQGPRENHARPAIDPTFRSAALNYGQRVIGVVLTGLLDDGTAGLMVIRAHGGVGVVQDPKTAMFPGMPASALERVPDAYVTALESMPDLLQRLVSEQIPQESPVPMSPALQVSETEMPQQIDESRSSKPSEFACPECGGVLWETDESGLLRFRCRVGHAYTARHLRAEQRYAVEAALWAALRALEESVSLYRRMAERTRNSNRGQTSSLYEERAANAEANVRTLRDFLVQVGSNREVDTPSE